LILVFADIFVDFQSKTHTDLWGNDHYPITISYGTKLEAL